MALKHRLCLIPGGPGLSSKTLDSLNLLSRSFNLTFIDPPGTGSSPSLPDQSFSSHVEQITARLSDAGPVILLGHSFGGLYATAVASKADDKVRGLILLGTPLTPESFAHAGASYEKNAGAEARQAEQDFSASPSDTNFSRWIASYGNLYFSPANVERGREMLLSDRASSSVFTGIRTSQILREIDFPQTLRGLRCRKLLLAGERDILLPDLVLAADAEKSNADFSVIRDAGHFMGFDQPETVARVIENFFATERWDS